MPRKISIGSKFLKVVIFCENFGNFEKIGKSENFNEGGFPALRVIRAGTRLTVHRSLPFCFLQFLKFLFF